MKTIMTMAAIALTIAGCDGLGGSTSATTSPVEVNVSVPEISITMPDITVNNDHNITIINPGSGDGGNSSSTDGSSSSSTSSSIEDCQYSGGNCGFSSVSSFVSSSSSSSAGTSGGGSNGGCGNGAYSNCDTCQNGVATDECGEPKMYAGEGTFSNQYKVFGNGHVPINQGGWTYYEFQNFGICDFKIVLPVFVQAADVYDINNSYLPVKMKGNVLYFESNGSAFIDINSYDAGFIDVFTQCWVGRK